MERFLRLMVVLLELRILTQSFIDVLWEIDRHKRDLLFQCLLKRAPS